MKRLLFLSFLLNTSCVDALKSMLEEPEEEEDEDEDDERREGQQQGDCLDGVDNDEDGDIDCDDSGCFDKPACDENTPDPVEPSDEPSSEPAGEPGSEPSGEPSSEEQVEFYGSLTQIFDFESALEDQGYNDCEINIDFTPGNGSISDASGCPGCTIFGSTEIRVETDCEWTGSGTGELDVAINPSQEIVYTYNTEDREWYPIMESSSCNVSYSANLSGNAINSECHQEESGQYSASNYMSFNW